MEHDHVLSIQHLDIIKSLIDIHDYYEILETQDSHYFDENNIPDSIMLILGKYDQSVLSHYQKYISYRLAKHCDVVSSYFNNVNNQSFN